MTVDEMAFYFESYSFTLNQLKDTSIKVIYLLHLREEDVSRHSKAYMKLLPVTQIWLKIAFQSGEGGP